MLQAVIGSLTEAAQAHPVLTLGVVAAVAFAESLAIVGTVVPAAVVMFVAGTVVAHGSLNVWATLLTAVIGAVLGDAVSYELGAAHHQRIRNWKLYKRHEGAARKAEEFIQRRGVASVAIARFAGAMRAFVPLLAGFAHMPRPRFYAVNILSAAVWAPVHILPGVLFGSSLKMAEAASARLAILLILVVALLWTAVWLANRSTRLMLQAGRHLRHLVLQWAGQRQSFCARVARAVAKGRLFAPQGLGIGLAMLATAMWVLFATLEDVVTEAPLATADGAVFRFLQQLRTDPADRVMILVTQMGSVGVMLPLVVAVGGWFLVRRSWRTAGYWLAAATGAELLVQVLKVSIGRTRPLEMYQGVERFAFPSGHTSMSTVVLGFLAFLLTREGGKAWRWAVISAATVYVTMVAFSRLYLGAHWFSDVVGGVSFGVAWVAIIAMVYSQRQVSERIETTRLAILSLAVIATAGASWVQMRSTHDAQQYSRANAPMKVTAAESWVASGWSSLPLTRQEGEEEERGEPFRLQWACLGADVQQRLAAAGWERGAGLNPASLLQTLVGGPLETLPILPRLDQGKRPSLVFSKTQRTSSGSERRVLRLWESGTAAQFPGRSTTPLWYGATYVQTDSGGSFAWLRERDAEPSELIRELTVLGTVKVFPAGGDARAAPPTLMACVS